MNDYSTFPDKIERWCCPGKSCGNTELELLIFTRTDHPPLYDYIRITNGNSYTGGFKTEYEMERWLEETKDHIQEELDFDARDDDRDYIRQTSVGKFTEATDGALYDVGVPYPVTPYDPDLESLDDRNITYTDEQGVESTFTLADLFKANPGHLTGDDREVEIAPDESKEEEK